MWASASAASTPRWLPASSAPSRTIVDSDAISTGRGPIAASRVPAEVARLPTSSTASGDPSLCVTVCGDAATTAFAASRSAPVALS
jgi:hypothetical protein